MKSVILIVLILVVGCKNNPKKEVNLEENSAESYIENDGLVIIKGYFLYDEAKNTAILQKDKNTYYKVVVDDNIRLLNEQVKPLKKEKYDMVSVTVRAHKTKNYDPNNFLKFKIKVKDILKVGRVESDNKNIIKLGN